MGLGGLPHLAPLEVSRSGGLAIIVATGVCVCVTKITTPVLS